MSVELSALGGRETNVGTNDGDNEGADEGEPVGSRTFSLTTSSSSLSLRPTEDMLLI